MRTRGSHVMLFALSCGGLPQSASLTAPSRGGLTFPAKYSKKALPRESLPFFRYAFYSAVNGSSAMLRARLMATVTWR